MIRWDDSSDPQNHGWVVRCRLDGRCEWMPPAPGADVGRDAPDDDLAAMAEATVEYHTGRIYLGDVAVEIE